MDIGARSIIDRDESDSGLFPERVIEGNDRLNRKAKEKCEGCKGVDCLYYDRHKKHFMRWEDEWLHTSDIRKPLIFHATGVKSYSPNTNISYWWQSRANRKQVPHHQNFHLKEGRRWWTYLYSFKPKMFAWWTALLFTFGSMVFVSVACALLNPTYAENSSLFLGIMAIFGASVFVVGGTCQILEVLQAPLVLTKQHFANLVRSSSLERVPSSQFNTDYAAIQRCGGNGFDVLADKSIHLCHRLGIVFGNWRRIDLTHAWIQWIGTLLFLISSFGTSGIWRSTVDPGGSRHLFIGVTIIPGTIASCSFIIAGWLQVIEASHSWYGGWHPKNIGWWIGINSTLGGIGFLANALSKYYVPGGFVSIVMLLVGSIFFFVGSSLAWIEQSQ